MHTQKLSKMNAGLIVALVVGSVGIAAIAGGNYKLAYRMQKGRMLKYKTTTNTDQSMEMQGQEMSFTVEGVTMMRLEVEQVSKAGEITFVYALDSMQTHVKSPQLDSTFRNPAELIGKRTRQVITASGKKLKATAIDSAAASGMMAQFASGQQGGFRLLELPTGTVKVGDSWTKNAVDTVMQGNNKIQVTPSQTYTITAEVDTLGYKCLRISYHGTVSIKGEGTNMGMNFFVEGEGPSQGTAYFAPKEGLLIALLDDTNLEMTIALTGQMSMTIPQSTSTKTATVLIK
ncbi:MAG: hypothetical protein ONA90_00755 [candidate division KSB1 bacterium]|nr:hypothetical protein [candidate division KSB1 bacterium]